MSWLKKDKLQYEFLPASEEIIETPAAPMGKMVIYLLTLLVAVVLVWSYFGRIDIVAVADGKISTENSTKIVQPAIGGVVTKINISEGAAVKKGDVLIELDKTVAKKEVDTIEQRLRVARVERDILRQMASGNSADSVIDGVDLPEETRRLLREFARTQAALMEARKQSFGGVISGYQQQLNYSQQTTQGLETTLHSLRVRQADISAQLPQTPPAERLRLQAELANIEQRIASLESAISSQKQQSLQSETSLNQAKDQSLSQIAELNSALHAQIVATEKQIGELENSLVKAKRALDYTNIVSPVDGTVLSLAVKTVGAVVGASERIVEIVPRSSPLYVDAMLENKDVGFVSPGQRVVVKVASYAFQRYGYLEGEVEYISPDAIHNENNGLMYRVKVKLAGPMSSKKIELDLTPGMNVSAEITTGQRRIIEFFLDPLITKTDGSLEVR